MQKPEIIDKIRLDLKGLYLLIIGNMLDSGRTLSHVTEIFKAMQSASLKTCVLLSVKRPPAMSTSRLTLWLPVSLTNSILGYGFCFVERYRQLPCIGVLRPELKNLTEWS